MITLLWTHDGATRDITRRVGALKLTGSADDVARALTLPVLRPRAFSGIDILPIATGDAVTLLNDGAEIFRGTIWAADTSSNADRATYKAYDGGVYLNKNTATLRVENLSPEQAALQLLRDYDIPAGVLPSTGVQLSHLFIAQPIYKIITTLFARAGALTGDSYQPAFIGGALHILRRGIDRETLVIRPGSNLLYSSAEESLDKTVNRVRIVDSAGNPVSETFDAGSAARYGLLSRDVKQSEGAGETAAATFHPIPGQTLTVRSLGDTRSISGRSVVIIDPVTGLNGLYHITSDAHSWEDGLYTNTLGLSYDRIAAPSEVGEAGEARLASGPASYYIGDDSRGSA